MTRSQVAHVGVQGHTVSVSLLSDSDDERRPDSGHEMTSDPSVHVHLRVHQPASEEEQLRAQLRQQEQLVQALGGRAAQLEAELGAREAQQAALLAEVALLRAQAAKAEQRISVLEAEVVALMQQAEQSSYEHALAQQVQPCSSVCAAVTCAMSLKSCMETMILSHRSMRKHIPASRYTVLIWNMYFLMQNLCLSRGFKTHKVGITGWLSVLASPEWAVIAPVSGILQELEALRGEASGESGTAWASLKQLHQEELAAAEQRVQEAAAEVQRLAAVAASCRKEVSCTTPSQHASPLTSEHHA